MNNIKEKILTAFVLGDGLLNKIHFLFYIFLFPVARICGVSVHSPCIRLRYNKVSFMFYPADGSDVGILRDIFLRKEYALYGVAPRVIVDLGSNVGISALYFAVMFPEAFIFCFEPDPYNFLKLQKNTKQFKHVTAFNTAVSSRDGFMDFYSNKINGMSSSLVDRGSGFHKVSVVAKTLDTILNELDVQRVDLLKFDIEGAEFSVFEHFSSFKKINRMIGEFHEDLSGRSLNAFSSLFPDFQIKESKRIQQKRYVLYMERV